MFCRKALREELDIVSELSWSVESIHFYLNRFHAFTKRKHHASRAVPIRQGHDNYVEQKLVDALAEFVLGFETLSTFSTIGDDSARGFAKCALKFKPVATCGPPDLQRRS